MYFSVNPKYQGYEQDNLVGILDELRFYDRALTENEINALFDEGKNIP